jgi:trehalose 6-phosphate phosphatase
MSAGTDGLSAALLGAVDELVHTDMLLVASDFDGTLAPIVVNSWEAAAPAAAIAALAQLGDLARTHTAILTGRSLAQLAGLGPLPASAVRIGSHGAEWGDRLLAPLTEDQAAALAEARLRAVALVHASPGAVLEDKPTGFAVHVRAMTDRARAGALPAELERRLADLPGVTMLHGKQVVEATVVHTSKGLALSMLRDAVGATAVFFAGDDVTDETAFEVLGPKDVGVKVGTGPTVATHRVPGPAAVTELLVALAAARAAVLS